MAVAVMARKPKWEKVPPIRYQLVHDGWQLDVWRFSGMPASWWYWSASRDGNYAGHGSGYETPDGACEAALKFAHLAHCNLEDHVFLSAPS